MPKSLKEQREALLKSARAIVDAADATGTPMTDDQLAEVDSKMKAADDLETQIKAAAERSALLDRVRGASFEPDDSGEKGATAEKKSADNLGEHFIKSAGNRLSGLTDAPGSVGAAEFKAANDPYLRPVDGTSGTAAWGVEFQRGIVNQKREKLVAADLMGVAQITLPTIKYLVEKANRIAEGAPTSVAEGAAKPYVRFEDLEMVTESLSKIAALTKLSDEMLEDYGFVADWINNQLIYELSVVEEAQLLNGDGSGANLTGLLQREGLQTQNIGADAEFDGLFEAMQLVPRATGLNADALVLNPVDYIKLRLKKDANQQYLAGGPYMGQYGNGGVLINPPIWGLRVVDTPSIAEGSYVLGAFRQGATVLRKGGLRVDATNTNDKDFENNLVTLRAEERIGLMVPRPAAFVTGTIGTSAGE